MATPIAAANAYAKLAKLADPGASLGKAAGVSSAGASSDGASFGTMVKDAINSVVEAGKKSDAQSRAMVAGKANLVDVVTAVTETEVAVQTLVSVRDKVIAAYEEIMRMPI
jgi:flagellar hook-basal body complex protein FliE